MKAAATRFHSVTIKLPEGLFAPSIWTIWKTKIKKPEEKTVEALRDPAGEDPGSSPDDGGPLTNKTPQEGDAK